MSQSTKRKHVTKEVLDDFELPKENQKIVRIVAGRGNNLHQVIEADEKTSYLVSMPTKFRKNVWIKRGDYCIVEPIEEGDKVKAEIVRILYKEQIRTIKTESQWPFVDKDNSKEKQFDLPPSSSDEEEDDLEPNPNRQQNFQEEEDEEEDSSDEDSQ
jgi:probable RNA-binding protein EIF1AD